MAARAIWKAVIHLGDIRVPVKLYSAIQDRDVHFRLLHAVDHAPVKQSMVNPDTEDVVPKESIRRGYFTSGGDLVMLNEEELETVEPEPSRDIQLLHFLPPEVIDHRWYRRPYYLGPDGSEAKYTVLIRAMEDSGREGLARWVMRNKSYVGALRLNQGYPLLIALRHAEEVVSIDAVKKPKGSQLDKRELSMAQQLIEMLADDFKPEEYHDEYRERIMTLIQTKASGGRVAEFKPRRKAASDDLSKALEASLRQGREKQPREKQGREKKRA